MSITDLELIEQSNAGNLSAFEQLMFRYDKEVLTIASRFTNSADDAKDIYQETFIRVYKGLPKFRKESAFSTWVYRIATNVCLTYRQKRRKLDVVMIDENGMIEGAREIPASSGGTETEIHSNELAQKIDDALMTLSPKQRMVFTLRHFSDYKIREIAVMMDCAEGTVKKYLFEAIRKMRICLQDELE